MTGAEGEEVEESEYTGQYLLDKNTEEGTARQLLQVYPALVRRTPPILVPIYHLWSPI